MSNIIRIKRGATGGVVPTGLTFGELAVNITDKKLFVGGITGNTIELLASGGGSGAAGTTGIQSLNGLTGDVTLTAGSNITLIQSGNLITLSASSVAASAPVLGSTSLTGVASFNPIYFTVSPTGHVGLASAYQVTGDTVVTSSGLSSIRSGNTVTITNIGVTAFNGLTGSVSMTGDGGAVYGIGNNTIAARVATTSVTGAASFNPVYFTTGTTGHVSLAAGYQVTGDTVSAGTGIGTLRSGSQITISNAGVLSFNGLTGQDTTLTGDGGAVRGVGNNAITARVSSASLTGVASFNINDFGVSATGHVSLTGNVARTDRDNAFSAAQTISSGGLSVSTGATFGSTVRFDGGIYLSTPSGLTGIEITRKETNTEGVYFNTIDSNDTLNIIQQSGNTANSLTVGTTRVSVGSVGGLQISPVVTNVDGASTTPTAPVQGKLIFTTVETSSAQYNATLTPTQLSSDRTYTLPDVTGIVGVVTPSGPGSNILRSINGATSGDLSITGDGSAVFGYGNGNSLYIGARNASASLTGVASFSTNDFVIGTTGHVGLTATVSRTNITNTFTAVQSFPNGISGAWLSIGAGATFNGRATFAQGLSSSSLWVGGGATFTGAVSISGGTAWHANNDGKGSGLDADLLRGVNGDRFLEEIQTGLLYGGVLSINAGNTGTVDVSAGAGIIVTVNAATGGYPAPTLQTIEWTAKTGVAVTGLTSSDFTFFRIDSSGNLQQSTSNFTQTEYLNSVVIGNAVHQSRAYVNRVHYHPIVAYASSAQYETFIRYFGGLKVDGYVLSGLGTTGQIQHTTGTAFALGANMDVDPNNPSLVTDSSAVPVQNLYYLYRNANGTYRTDPVSRSTVNFGNYDDGDGTLGNVGNQSWTIQRVYKIPGFNSALYIYYGTAVYGSLTVASNNILLESFAEADITRYNGVFLGWLIVRGNGSDVSDSGDCRIIPGGFFRNTTGGGGASTQLNLDDLGDVAVTTPANNQILRYDSAQGLWVNSPLSSVSTLASTSLTGVASFNSNDFIVGTTGHVGLTGTVARTNAAQTFSGVQAFSNGITTASLWVGGGGATFTSAVQFIGNISAPNIVNSVNGFTGAVSITSGSNVTLTQTGNLITIAAAAASASAPQLATSSLTGVASFKLADFTVSATGNVGLTGTVARTNVDNLFSSTQTFNNYVNVTNVYSSSSPPALYFNAVGEDSVGIVFDSPTTVDIGDVAGYNSGAYMTVNSGGSFVDLNSTLSLQNAFTLGLWNGEYIANGTNGRMDFLPAPATASAFGLYADMTSWGYGVVLGTIRSSDSAVNTGGNIRFDVPLTINTNTYFQLGSDGQYRFSRTSVGNDTVQFAAFCDGVNNSGAYAIVGQGSEGTANRSPVTNHTNPNLYIYKNGNSYAGDFMRMEHDGAVGRIASGGTSNISLEPASGTLNISGGAVVSSVLNLTGSSYIKFANGTTMGKGPSVTTQTIDFSSTIDQIEFVIYGSGVDYGTSLRNIENIEENLNITMYTTTGPVSGYVGVLESIESFYDSTNGWSARIVIKPPFTDGESAETIISETLSSVYIDIAIGLVSITDFWENIQDVTLRHKEATYVTKTVTGQSWVTADSFINCKVLGLTTADHTPEDAIIEGVKFEINNIVVGTGFDIIGHAPEGTYGKYSIKCLGQ
jgi:hypothetical protein